MIDTITTVQTPRGRRPRTAGGGPGSALARLDVDLGLQGFGLIGARSRSRWSGQERRRFGLDAIAAFLVVWFTRCSSEVLGTGRRGPSALLPGIPRRAGELETPVGCGSCYSDLLRSLLVAGLLPFWYLAGLVVDVCSTELIRRVGDRGGRDARDPRERTPRRLAPGRVDSRGKSLPPPPLLPLSLEGAGRVIAFAEREPLLSREARDELAGIADVLSRGGDEPRARLLAIAAWCSSRRMKLAVFEARGRPRWTRLAELLGRGSRRASRARGPASTVAGPCIVTVQRPRASARERELSSALVAG